MTNNNDEQQRQQQKHTTNNTTINLDLLSLLLCGRENNNEVNANHHPIYGAACGGIVYPVAIERIFPLLTSCPSFTNHPTIQPSTNPPNQPTPAWQSPPSHNILAGLCLCKLLLAVPDIVAPATTTRRMRHHTACLLKLP
jgi:hypothetical protein